MPPSVIIFRKRLLSYSETFIADQGQMLPTYQPVYCGFSRDNSGFALIQNSPSILLNQISKSAMIDKIRFRLGFGICDAWLQAVRKYQPLLIHAHFFNDGIDAIKLGARLGLPVITTVHGHDITKYENADSARGRTRNFFERVDCVIAVSKFMAEQARQRGCPEDKLEQHYIGIDLEKFTEEKQETPEPTLLFVGRLVEKKGCTYLLQAMEQLKVKFPQLKLTIIGDGELKAALQQEAAARGLQVNFAGTASAVQIRAQLARCWAFVAPSVTAADGDAEGLGMVFLEAQALHTPVVSFSSGGVVEAVEDQVTGLLCAERDVIGLAGNIETLLENESLRRRMGEQGRRRVEMQFDVRKQCAKLEQIYAKLG